MKKASTPRRSSFCSRAMKLFSVYLVMNQVSQVDANDNKKTPVITLASDFITTSDGHTLPTDKRPACLQNIALNKIPYGYGCRDFTRMGFFCMNNKGYLTTVRPIIKGTEINYEPYCRNNL